MSEKKYILSKEVAAQKLQRLVLEIAERLDGDDAELIIIGIRNSGMVIAQKIAEPLKKYINVPVKVISAGLNKDFPVDVVFSEEVDFNKKNVIIADDVSNTGKTLLYALKPILNSHPKRIQTLVLVERMHNLFPIKPDYVGLSVSTTMHDHIEVVVENGEVAGAFIK
ncbi:phosphoribosyltransferase family protein [Chitinophagaceae bacterium LWZ2-11]